MNRCVAILLLGGIVLTAGCRSEPAPTPPPSEPKTPPKGIQAVEPRAAAQQVSRRPTFRWQLTRKLANPNLVSFALAEAGTGDQPVTQADAQKEVAFASGLHSSSPTEVDLWNPPADAVVTGDATEASQLKAETWYRWTVRALADGAGGEADFYFRTRSASAVPAADGTPPKNAVDVILIAVGEDTEPIVKAIQETTGLSKRQAQGLVERLPQPIRKGVSPEQAETIRKTLELAGAAVELR